MTPAEMFIVALLKYGPDVAETVANWIDKKGMPTQAEREALLAKIRIPFDTLVPPKVVQ